MPTKCQKCQAMKREGSTEIKQVRIIRRSGNSIIKNLCDTCLTELQVAAAKQQLPVRFEVIK
jgi:hypothetical protein